MAYLDNNGVLYLWGRGISLPQMFPKVHRHP